MARTKQTARKSFPGGDVPRKQLAGIRKKPRRARPPPPRAPESWEHPEASWEAHERRRDEDYEQEMEHAFGNWGGVGGARVGLEDETDLDGTPLYVRPVVPQRVLRIQQRDQVVLKPLLLFFRPVLGLEVRGLVLQLLHDL